MAVTIDGCNSVQSDDASYEQRKTIADDQIPGDELVDLLFTGVKTDRRYSLRIENDVREARTLFEHVPFAQLSSLTRRGGQEVDSDEPPRVCGRRLLSDECVIVDEA